MNRFTFNRTTAGGETIYGASHELHNQVLITFPAGYWDSGIGITKPDQCPLWVELPFDSLTYPEYREPPVNDVIAELQRRLPNLIVENMWPGFVAVHVPGLGLLACGGDNDGWRIEHHGPDCVLDQIPVLETGLETYEQDVNCIATALIYQFTKSPWRDVIFTTNRRPKGA